MAHNPNNLDPTGKYSGMHGTYAMPAQTKTFNEKEKDDNQWAKETMESILRMSSIGYSGRSHDISKNYDVVYGIIDDADYQDLISHYGEKREDLPNALRNYPLLNTDMNVLKGEKNGMGANFYVTSSNPDVETEKEEVLSRAIWKETNQEFANEFNRNGEDTGVPTQQTRNLREVKEDVDKSFKSQRAIMGQEAINYIYYNEELHDQFLEDFEHYLTSGYAFSWKGVRNNDVKRESLPPTCVDYDKESRTEFVEDGDWALYRVLDYRSRIVEEFYEELTEDQIKHLETPDSTGRASTYFPVGDGLNNGIGPARTDIDRPDEENSRGMDGTRPHPRQERLIEKIYICWKSLRKVGFLKYRTILGETEEMVVDEDYKPRKELGEEIEWKWINEVWEGWKIDNQFWLGIRPVQNQRNGLNNISECKLPINGRAHTYMNNRNMSFVDMGKPFQITYNIYRYKLNNAIAKAKDVIAMLDINMVPKGYTPEQWLYTVEKTGVAWTDYSAEALQHMPAQHQNVLNLSLQTIEQYSAILNQVIAEWERVSGVNAQRKAQIGQYQGKATTEQAIIQSNYMTDDYFRKFQRFEQRELQGLLDLSKIAWTEGKKGSYLTPSERMQMISIDGQSHKESEYTVFVTNSREDLNEKRKAEELIQPHLQAGGYTSDALEILRSNSIDKIYSKIKEAEKVRENRDQELQQSYQEGYKKGKQEKVDAAQREQERKDRELDHKITNEQRSTDIEEREVEYDYEIDKEGNQIQRQNNQNNEGE